MRDAQRLPLRRFPALIPLLALLLAVTACGTVPRRRTLPASVRTVAVPMFINRTAEPLITQDATVLTQREFLSDGRLKVVREEEADAIVRVTLVDFEDETGFQDIDDFPILTDQEVVADVVVTRNVPEYPPIGGPRRVRVNLPYVSDTRNLSYTPEPDARHALLEELARQIVLEVLTGDFESDQDASPAPGHFAGSPDAVGGIR